VALVATCLDPAVVAGDLVSACASADLVWKEETTFWDPALSLTDVSELLAAVLVTFAIVWGVRLLLSVILNKR